jgi:hypothetical protein
MVLLHYKKTDHNQFLYEVAGARLVGELQDELVESKATAIQSTT